MWFREEDILDAMLFEPLDNWQLVSLIPEEKIMLLSEPQDTQVAVACPPRCQEKAPGPKNATKPMGAAPEPQGMWVCPPPPGFEPLLPKQDVPLIGIPNPNGSQSALMPVSAMSIIIYKNNVMGNLEYEYETHCPRHPESLNHSPKINDLSVIEWVFCSEVCGAKWRLKNEDYSIALIGLYQNFFQF